MAAVVSGQFSEWSGQDIPSKMSALKIGPKQGSFLLKSDEPNRKVFWKISDDQKAVNFDHESSNAGGPAGSADAKDCDMYSIAKNIDQPLSLRPEGQCVSAVTFPDSDTDSMWSSVVEQPEKIVEPLAQFIYDHGHGELTRIDKELFKTYIKFRERTNQDRLQQSLKEDAEQRNLAKILMLPKDERLTTVDVKACNTESGNNSGCTTITKQRIVERTRITQQVSITTHGGQRETPVGDRDSPDARPFNTVSDMFPSCPASESTEEKTTSAAEECAPRSDHEVGATGGKDSDAGSNQMYLLFMDLAEKVAGGGQCTLRELAFRLDFEEAHVGQIEKERPGNLQMQFYELLRSHLSRSRDPIYAYPKLLKALEDTKQNAIASWLRKQYQEKEASLRGDDDCGTGTSPAVLPRNQPRFYDICLKHGGNTEHLAKFNNIIRQQSWKVFVFDEFEILGAPILRHITKILETSSHLVLLIDEDECHRYEKDETACMTLEMAFQLAESQQQLAGKIIPIRCCDKRRLPLALQALVGARIDDEKLGTKLANTVDPSIRKTREEEARRRAESSLK